MNRYFRLMMVFICAFQAVFAVGYILQMQFALDVWPLAYTNRMSFLFIASIFAAAAASTLWAVASGEYGALTGIALDYLTIFVPMAIFAFQIMGNNDKLTLFAVACTLGVIFGGGLLLWSRRIPIHDPRPMPRLVYWSFVYFVVNLVIAGGLLVTKTPNILPWTITKDGSVIYGWIFFGAAAYFAYSVLRPSWHNAVGQLAGFLAYDLVLILPFLQMLPTISPERRLSLLIYIAAVTYSGLLAIYYLFIHPETRLWRASASLRKVAA